jgi:hypothetical protein
MGEREEEEESVRAVQYSVISVQYQCSVSWQDREINRCLQALAVAVTRH